VCEIVPVTKRTAIILLMTLPAQGQQIEQPWYNKGLASIKQGKFNEAIRAFNEAIRINPQLTAPWLPVTHYFPEGTVLYYDIVGLTAEDLRAQMDALGPIGPDGYKSDAFTIWSTKWGWPPCQIDKATVSYEIMVLFPRWKPPRDASAQLVAKWDDYIRALATHEKGHVDYIVKNYRLIVDAIKKADCYTAELAAQAALSLLRSHDVEYDAITNHGATQGARFP